MDYTAQDAWFRAVKALRYVRLYGPRRTLAKIRGQYHMKKDFSSLPIPREQSDNGTVGLLGAGNFCFSNIAYYLSKNHGRVMRGVMDPNTSRAASLYEHYKLDYYTDNAQDIIDDPLIDLVYIASNHASHAEYAIEALKAGKSVHIEKPHVVSFDQLIRLCKQMELGSRPVNLGFNRPHSRIGQLIRDALWSQEGAAMMNWFVAGHAINPDHWYFKKEEGGRVLGNLCHWTDFIYNMVPETARFPIIIRPTRAQKSDCDIAVTFTFGDGTIGVITFSAKGHTFEGVRERFAAHRGNVLISMDDFQRLTIENVAEKRNLGSFFRDHGHELTIMRSYEWARQEGSNPESCTTKYVWETGELFLRTREALESGSEVTMTPFDDSKLYTNRQ